MKVPFSTTLCLFAYGEGGIIYGTVLEELLIYILHFNNEFLAFVVLAIYIEYSTACISTIAKLFGIKILDVLNVLFPMEHGVQEADKQFLVKL